MDKDDTTTTFDVWFWDALGQERVGCGGVPTIEEARAIAAAAMAAGRYHKIVEVTTRRKVVTYDVF